MIDWLRSDGVRRAGTIAAALRARAAEDPRGLALRLGVASLGIAVVYNAAFAQAGPHAAPWFGGASVAAVEAAAPKRPRAIPDPVVFGLQSELTDLGFYEGAIDGIAGSRTRSAIEAYERAEAMEVTGLATEALLNRMRVAAPQHLPRHLPRPSGGPSRDETGSIAPAAPPAPDPAAAARERVRAVQAALRAAGHDIAADGLMGPNTRAAIEAWEGEQGLPVEGEPSDALLRRMRGAGLL